MISAGQRAYKYHVAMKIQDLNGFHVFLNIYLPARHAHAADVPVFVVHREGSEEETHKTIHLRNKAGMTSPSAR